jgi:serine/threonine protein kinase
MRCDLAKDMELQDTLRLCMDIGVGLKAIHEASMYSVGCIRSSYCLTSIEIVHCDLKPSNIFICRDKNHKAVAEIADFGHAAIGYSENTIVHLPGSIICSAPDHHLRGFRFHEAMTFDIWACGLIVYWFMIVRKVTKADSLIIDKMLEKCPNGDTVYDSIEYQENANSEPVRKLLGLTAMQIVIKYMLAAHGLNRRQINYCNSFFQRRTCGQRPR